MSSYDFRVVENITNSGINLSEQIFYNNDLDPHNIRNVHLRSPKTLGELEKVVNQVWEAFQLNFETVLGVNQVRVVLVKKSIGQKIKYGIL